MAVTAAAAGVAMSRHIQPGSTAYPPGGLPAMGLVPAGRPPGQGRTLVAPLALGPRRRLACCSGVRAGPAPRATRGSVVLGTIGWRVGPSTIACCCVAVACGGGEDAGGPCGRRCRQTRGLVDRPGRPAPTPCRPRPRTGQNTPTHGSIYSVLPAIK